jgi:hypothetical protein
MVQKSKDNAERQVIVIAGQSGSPWRGALQEFLLRVRIAGRGLGRERIVVMGLDSCRFGVFYRVGDIGYLSFGAPPRKFPPSHRPPMS